MTDPRPDITLRITRGARRGLAQMGFESLAEFPLPGGRRADLMGVGPDGEIVIVEVKSGAEDFLTDGKWPEYQAWCDRFWFAVARDFPLELIPDGVGLMIADEYGAGEVRPAEARPLAAARRKALMRDIARTGLSRLRRLEDPPPQSDI